ncbi:hypothetical protein Tco_0899457 [Tanacetum coccineum]
MSPSKRKFHWGIMRPTGIKRYIDPISGHKIKRTNRRRRIDKEGNVSRFQEYHTSDEEEEELSNMNGWLTEDANDSDLESTASNQPMNLTMEDTAGS